MRIRRLLAVCGVVALPLMGAGVAPASAAPDDPASRGGYGCEKVLVGDASGSLTKSGPRSVAQNPDGSSTLTYDFTTNRPDGTYRAQDCAFVDENGTGKFDRGDRIVANSDKQTQVIRGHGTVTVTIPPRNVKCVCERLALVGVGFLDTSDLSCGDHMPAGGAVGAAGFGVLGGVGLLGAMMIAARRRRVLAPAS